MSEEKKAIEILKEIKDVRGIRQDVEGENEDLCALDIVYNLIDKQQKEIEDLKAITQNYNAIGGETFGDDRIIVCSMKYFYDGYFKNNYISKDKIREKIEELKEIADEDNPDIYIKIDAYKELLEEN